MISQRLTIRPETPLDYPAITEVHTLAFERNNEAQLVGRVRASRHYIPNLSLIAELNHTIIGHILLSYVNLIGAEQWQIISLAPIAVRPNFHNQGVGSQLVQIALERAEAMGERLVVVLGHPQFYSRFGFKSANRYGIEAPFPVPEEAIMIKPLQNYRQNFRGKVIYPSAFDEV